MNTLLIMQSEAANGVPNHIAFPRILANPALLYPSSALSEVIQGCWHFICHSVGFLMRAGLHENKKVASKKNAAFLVWPHELHYRGHDRRM